MTFKDQARAFLDSLPLGCPDSLMVERLAKQFEEVAQEERVACAHVCDDVAVWYDMDGDGRASALECSRRVRLRGMRR